ncbi:MAG: hypothetical protein ACYTG0_37055, partial [Planctomycetota bacterium]
MAKKGGRTKGRRNKGYWYRNGRGWYVTEGARAIPLRDPETGQHVCDKTTPDATLQLAYAHYQVDRQRRTATGPETPMMEICRAFVEHCHKTRSTRTCQIRADHLFNFATGFPARFRISDERPTRADRIHKGYGAVAVEDLTPQDAQDWLDANPWGPSTVATAVSGLIAAINHAVRMKRISSNPIRGYRPGKWQTRITYFSEATEAAMYEHANDALALAIRVCIRTGA